MRNEAVFVVLSAEPTMCQLPRFILYFFLLSLRNSYLDRFEETGQKLVLVLQHFL